MNNYSLEAVNASIKSILDCLGEIRMTEQSIKVYQNVYNALTKYMEQNALTSVNEEFLLKYLCIKTGVSVDSFYGYYRDRKLNQRMRPLQLLLKHLESGQVCLERRKPVPPFQCPDEFVEEYSGFLCSLSDRGLSQASYRTNETQVAKFLHFLSGRGLGALDLIEVPHLDEYLSQHRDKAVKYRGAILYVLRKFFSFLFESGYTVSNLSDLLPRLQIPRAGDIPHAWTKDELRGLLGAIDRESPTGKRDYAMLILIMHTGLRFADTRNLRFKDINWNSKKISIVARKTGQPIELPLLDVVGWAIIDYVKNGRPQSTSDCIFIRHRPPRSSLGGSAGINKAMHRYLVKAGILSGIKGHHGVHSLRNTLARNMLDTGTPLPVISQTLGHRNINTTAIYLKIDIEGLRRCALAPEEELRP